jgi:hypothetical protein
MPILIITVLLAASLVVVLYPVVFRLTETTTDDAAQQLAEGLRRQRDRVYEEMRALQQERFLRHLSDEEYEARLQAARVQAASLLRQQERVQETLARLDQELEEEIRQARQAQQTAGDQSQGPE